MSPFAAVTLDQLMHRLISILVTCALENHLSSLGKPPLLFEAKCLP